MKFLSYLVGLCLCAYGIFRGALLAGEVGPDALLPMAISSAELPLALLLFFVGLLFLIAPGLGAAAVDDADPRIPAMRQDIEELRAQIGRLDRPAPAADQAEARAEVSALARRLDALAEQVDQLSTPEEELPITADDYDDFEPPEPSAPPEPVSPPTSQGLVRDLPEYERLLLGVMISMIGVDGAMEDSEIGRTCEAFGAITGHAVEPAAVRSLSGMMNGADDIEQRLRAAASGLDADQKRSVIEGAYIVSVADDELHPEEMAAMHRIGGAMGLGMDEIHRMIDECIGKY